MAAESVSFRITRSTEDLAQTVSALSQRLVKLEQRLAALELQLDRVASLLADCRSLLEEEPSAEQHGASWPEPQQHEDAQAA